MKQCPWGPLDYWGTGGGIGKQRWGSSDCSTNGDHRVKCACLCMGTSLDARNI